MNNEKQHELTFFTEPSTGDIFELMADGFSMMEARFEAIERLLERVQEIQEVA